MTPSDLLDWGEWKPLVTAVGIVAIVGASLFGLGYWRGAKKAEARANEAIKAAMHEADVQSGIASMEREHAKVSDAKVIGLQSSKDRADNEARILRAKLAKLPRPNAADAGVTVGPVEPIADPGDGTGYLLARIGLQDELIQAQEAQVKTRDALILTLTESRNHWKASADAGAVEALNLRAALAAKDGLIRAAQIKGFAYGFAFGAASGGYAGYRVGKR